MSEQPGNVREFDSCQGNIGRFYCKSGKCQGKILSGNSGLKLFIVSCIFAANIYCADQTPEVVWQRGPGRQVSISFPCSTSLHIACPKELEAASRSSKTYLAKDGGGRSAPIQSWPRVRASESSKQNSLADTHRNSNVTDKLRLMITLNRT